MSMDVNNQYTGQLFGQDRIGHTTPDLEASESYRPWLPVAFPAPYLPGLRQDQGHPKFATKVLSSQMLVGLDKSGALVPAGLFCGTQKNGAIKVPSAAVVSGTGTVITFTIAAQAIAIGESFYVTDSTAASPYDKITCVAKTGTNATTLVADIVGGADGAKTAANFTVQSLAGGQFCFLKYAAGSIDAWAVNPLPASAVATKIGTAGAVKMIACPADAYDGQVVTLNDGSTKTITTAEITAAKACDLFPTGVARPVGVATRDVYQYIGGVTPVAYTGGLQYTLDPMNPVGFTVHNYTHEMGTAIQTDYVIRVPYIGTSRYALTALAATDSLTAGSYVQGYGLSFTHFTGTPKLGSLVVASREQGDAGNYASYDASKHSLEDVCGRVIGFMNMIDKIGYMARVKTLWDPSRMVGPYKDPNSASIMMGGSATAGLPYDINLTTDGAYKTWKDQKKTLTGKSQLGSYVLVRVNL